jgi:hypothetical protein
MLASILPVSGDPGVAGLRDKAPEGSGGSTRNEADMRDALLANAGRSL